MKYSPTTIEIIILIVAVLQWWLRSDSNNDIHPQQLIWHVKMFLVYFCVIPFVLYSFSFLVVSYLYQLELKTKTNRKTYLTSQSSTFCK